MAEQAVLAQTIAPGAPQQAPQNAPVSQSWNANNSYAGAQHSVAAEKAKLIDAQEAVGKKLYVNDFVTNVQGAPSGVGQVQAGKGASAAGSQMGTGRIAVTGGNLSVAANNAEAVGQAAQDLGQAQAADVASNQNAVADEAKMAVDANEPNSKVLGEARANAEKEASMEILRREPRSSDSMDSLQSLNEQSASMASAVPVAAPAPALLQQAQQQLAEASAMASTPATTPNAPGQSPPREELHVAGAISLPVDFPTEGRLYHFKKLNSNAKLTCWVVQPQGLARWKALLALLVAVAMIRAGGKYFARRAGHRIARPRLA
jgi:hypothetical protein